MDSIATTSPLGQDFPPVGWGNNSPTLAAQIPSPPKAKPEVDLNDDVFSPEWSTAMEALQYHGDLQPLVAFLLRGKGLSARAAAGLAFHLSKKGSNFLGYDITLKRRIKRGKPSRVHRMVVYCQMKEMYASGLGVDAVVAEFEERLGMARSNVYKIWKYGQELESTLRGEVL